MDTDSNKKFTPPGLFVDKTLSDLKAAKELHLLAADEIDHSIHIIEIGKKYWDHVDPHPFQTTPTGTASASYLEAMSGEAASLRAGAADAYAQARAFNSTASVFGTVTASAHSFVSRVEVFNPSWINDAITRPNKDEEYARKFEDFDPELGKLYRQILEVRTRTSSHPEKSILSDIRQAYDHLMRKLAPGDEVRVQPGWKPEDPKKPEMVTRRQRLEYAAKKHIRDENHRATILASSKHILAVYKELNDLYHTEKPIEVDKARAASQAMIEVLNQWADALGL